ncbi:hypothetical protein KSP40_PGU006319 [Platanthera guangdongensis]|uniref:Uncharacterized protein n=1 Tax=Platanthera guangdongensis TaxID=2320717 RepID=A0ABR2LCF0_9ASPA
MVIGGGGVNQNRKDETLLRDPPIKRPKGVSNVRIKGHWEKNTRAPSTTFYLYIFETKFITRSIMILIFSNVGKRGDLKSKAIPMNDNRSKTKVYNFFDSPEPMHQSTPQATPANIDSH